MNYFALILIVALCGAVYYENTDFEKKNAASQQRITDLSAKVDDLKAANKTLENDKTRLTKTIADDQAEIADLASQIQAAKGTQTEAQQQAAPKATNASPSPEAATAKPTPVGNNLGTITTLDGKTYQNCQLLKIKADGIVVNYSDGITEIRYGLLPPDLQKKFGYDPHQAAALTEAQIQYQEEQRKAATAAAGH